MLGPNDKGFFPYTPATNLLYGLREAIAMLEDEGLDNVFARHDRHAEATRRAAAAWGLEVLCAVPEEYSSSLTALVMPAGHDADNVGHERSANASTSSILPETMRRSWACSTVFSVA